LPPPIPFPYTTLFRSISVTGVLLVVAATLALPLGATVATHLFPIGGAWGVTTLRLVLAFLFLLVIARPTPWRWSGAAWRDVVLLDRKSTRLNSSHVST